MAKVNIFISSTCFDLSQIRNDIMQCIESLGHHSILSEQNGFPVNPNLSNVENCINAVKKEADIFVLIIGNKYGSILESGMSITNTEFMTAANKGIPVYTFALKQMTTLLPMWERNPDADFSDVVDNKKVFEFLLDVRKKRGIWNFEFEKAQDICETLKVQLSNLFHEALLTRHMILSSEISELYSKISSKALSILLKKDESYEVRFFLQAMSDEIDSYKDLKNDYRYSVRIKSANFLHDFDQLVKWMQHKFGQAQNYISSLNSLTDAFHFYYADPGVPSDIEGLYYVARSFAKIYASLLDWGIDVKSTIVPDEYQSLLTALADIPAEAITQIENCPKDSLKIVEETNQKVKSGESQDGAINLNLEITISEEAIEHYNEELKSLKDKILRQASEFS